MNIINITPTAKEYLIKQCESHNCLYIRLSVKGGGCAGFSYEYEFATHPADDDELVPLDNECNFLIDKTSVLFVIGTTLDYVSEISGSSLKIINPNETTSCGCGKSFSV